MCDGEIVKMIVDNALHALNLAHNLIFLSSLIKKGVKVGLENRGAVLTVSDRKTFMRCKMEGTICGKLCLAACSIVSTLTDITLLTLRCGTNVLPI